MTLDIGVAKLRWEYVSLVWTKFCLQQRKNSFLLAFIEILQNCSYKSSFCTSNLWPVICFPLSTALLHSSLLTRACASIVFLFNTIEVNGYSKLFILNILQKYLLFCSTEKKKFTQLWNNLRVGKRKRNEYWLFSSCSHYFI